MACVLKQHKCAKLAHNMCGDFGDRKNSTLWTPWAQMKCRIKSLKLMIFIQKNFEFPMNLLACCYYGVDWNIL